MTRREQIKNAYKLTGGHAGFYDGMMTYSTLPGKAICRIVWNMDGDKNLRYLERALSGIPEDFSAKMLKRAEKNCAAFKNITFSKADITALVFPDCSFDKVVAGNVIHLLDNPLTALGELNRVCKDGGMLIIPTYMNKNSKGKTSGFAATVGKAGADFKRQFTVDSYRQFFLDAGYSDVQIILADGRIPCAVAVMKKEKDHDQTRTDKKCL